MRRICLVFLVHESFDCVTHFERAFQEVNFDVELLKIPFRWRFDRKYVNELKALLAEKSRNQFVFFSPQSTELFLREADFTIVYSAYRNWFNHENMRVIPHLWTPAKPRVPIDELRWANKPPIRIGFMGRTYANNWQTKIISKTPMRLKHWLLKGSFLRYPGVIALLNEYCGFATKAINTFPRLEVLRLMQEKKNEFQDVELDIIESGFHGADHELSAYMAHLERNTYIVCPRGSENYSYRMYEALSHGRIPVIIDTDIVLPNEIPWDRLSVRIPYKAIGEFYKYILHDHNSHSKQEFLERQKEAFTVMAELQTMHWIKKFAQESKTLIGARST